MCILLILATALAINDDAQLQRLKTFREEFVAITPGKGKFPASFLMGSKSAGASPMHRVTFDYSFHVAKYEVPQNLWQAVMGSNPSRWKGQRNSVENLSYTEAVAFCEKATGLMRAAKLIGKDEEIRLPSEAEWEYFARAGTKTKYSFGDDEADIDAYAWSTRNAAGNDPAVGVLKPNPWGLYDIHGYLWEFCSDVGHATYQGAPDDGSSWGNDSKTETENPALGKPGRESHVIRGGSWKDAAEKLACGYRSLASYSTRDDAIGLRCVLAKVRMGRKEAVKLPTK